jgi:hypothetical protein
MQNITAFAFNFWWIIFRPQLQIVANTDLFNFSDIRLVGSPIDSIVYAGLPLRYWGILFFLIFSIPFYFKIIRSKISKISDDIIVLIFALSALLAFLFLPRMHERYMYPLFPLFALYIGYKKRYIWLYILFSLFHMLNLYFVWHPMRIFFVPYEFIMNIWVQWSISLGIIFLTIIFYIETTKKNKKT